MLTHPRQALFQAMHEGYTLITPNNRLSQQILHDYITHTQSTKRLAIDKPQCIPYTTFLTQLYQNIRHQHADIHHPVLLNEQHARTLWRDIISESRATPCNDGLLDTVMSAWTSCENWLLEPTHPAFELRPQTRQFQQWFIAFHQRLSNLHAITTHQIVPYLMHHDALIKKQASILWVCFDEWTPSQRALQLALEKRGAQHVYYDLDVHTTKAPVCIETTDARDEYDVLIQWIKQQRAENKQRIGVVIPQLTREASTLKRLLSRHFSDDELNLSLGKTLLDYPLVAHALQWLSLDLVSIDRHQAQLLLSSPYLTQAASEWLARAHLMQHHPLLQETHIPFLLFKQQLNATTPHLKAALDKLINYPAEDTLSGWVLQFKQRLSILGFPGDHLVNSATYQCFQRFTLLFDEFQSLATVMPMMTQDAALHAITDLAKSTIFQPQKQHAPIQILGLLEASGCLFDSLWVTGMTDHELPQPTRFSAFIPMELQRELQMPHTSIERELHFSTSILQRLQHGSPLTYFSYPRLIEDRPCMPSPLIAHMASIRFEQTIAPTQTQSVLEPYFEPYHLPMLDTENPSGGSSLLAYQAQCPFRAFAAHRLRAKTTPDSQDGLNASERGQLIHRILELIWTTLEDQATLLRYADSQLETLIQSSISSAFEPLLTTHPLSFPPFIQSIERNRLTRLVHASLAWERARPPFRIKALEHPAIIPLAGLNIQIKIDRIDSLPSGEEWIIDYKSRIPSAKPWLEERPEAPQLLLYALLNPSIRGILFLELRHGRVACSGLSATPTSIPGLQALKDHENWDISLATWKSQLESLALEFQSGHHTPTPTRNTTCLTCDFQSLCRIA